MSRKDFFLPNSDIWKRFNLSRGPRWGGGPRPFRYIYIYIYMWPAGFRLDSGRLDIYEQLFIRSNEKNLSNEKGHCRILIYSLIFYGFGSQFDLNRARTATDLVFVSAHFRPRNALKRYEFKGFWWFSVPYSRCTHLPTGEENVRPQKNKWSHKLP